MGMNRAAITTVYIGGYTDSPSLGERRVHSIEVYGLDTATGSLTFVQALGGLINPSYLALDPHQQYVYCVEEKAEGMVHAFSIDPMTGALASLNHQSSYGSGPAHVSVDREGRWVFVANYDSGSVAVLPVQVSGRIGPATTVVQHASRRGHTERQQGPHPHWIGTDPANRIVLVADLGLDAVVSYHLDVASGKLIRAGVSHTIQPGAGPRHLAFRRDGHYVYVLNELDSTLIACAYDATNGDLYPIQSISTISSDVLGPNWPAAIRLAPSGQFVYCSNRASNNIVIFAGDPATGLLTCIGHEVTQGHTPRDFNINPSGTFLLVANQESDTIITFHIDAVTGQLSKTGHVTTTHSPTCIAFGPTLTQPGWIV